LATHKSSEKRARQSVKRAARNTGNRGTVKSFEKTLLKAIESKSKDVEALFKTYMSKMDKAAQKGAFARTTASRKISRLASRISALIK
jgi:small subunit ribosomal protein S20